MMFSEGKMRARMKLRAYLDEKRITYREFAEKLGVHLQSLKNIVDGIGRPSLEIAVKIEELTNGEVAPKDLIASSSIWLSCANPICKALLKLCYRHK